MTANNAWHTALHMQVRIERARDVPKFTMYKHGLLTAVRLRHGSWSAETPVAARSYEPEWQACFTVPLATAQLLELDLCRRSKLQGLKCLASTALHIPPVRTLICCQ